MKKSYSYLLSLTLAIMGGLVLAATHGSEDVSASASINAVKDDVTPRRLEVLFLGSPNGSHRPLDRFHTLRRAHGVKGINYTYANQPTALSTENLAKYDALLIYGNHDKISKEQETALLNYSTEGGACVFLHSACGCFANSEKFIALVGAQFKSHGRGVFRTKIVKPNHPVMKGFPGFECWDESYVHQKHNPDRTVLQKREDEPWTWVRTNGKGRIFYTASGHDNRCWGLDEYQDLVFRGVMWTVGDKKAKLVKDLNLPELEYKKSPVDLMSGPQWKDRTAPRKSDAKPIPDQFYQKPLTPKESLKLAQIPVGMELQLFASEPMVANPIAMSWDNKGRMWVVEAYDYPNRFVMNSPGLDRIKILEDTNGDGMADKDSIFAEGLTIATSVLPFEGGCLTTDGENMVYLEDTNGDGKSDKRTVVFKGISLYDTHACVSNLRKGLDGWIYATVGYSGVKTVVNGETHHMKQGVFRFKIDGSAFEIIQGTTNNTWGLTLTEEGRLMGSTANMNPSFYVGIPNRLLKGTGIRPEKTPRADQKDRVFPITFDHIQVDWQDHFTAAAGHSIYTARLFPKEWWNKKALICEPTGKLVSAATVSRNGSGFSTHNTEFNLYASADAWSAPVAAEVGPDGAIYIADWYNPIIQHNVYQKREDVTRGKGNAYVSEVRDRNHGRIYRMVPKGAKPSAQPSFSNAAAALKALDHPNMLWRMHAQELILKQGASAIPALKKIANGQTKGKLHAIHVLGQLGQDTFAYFSSKTVFPGANAAALCYAPKTPENAVAVLASSKELSADDRLACLLFIAEVPQDSKVKKAVFKFSASIAGDLKKDRLLKRASNVALSKQGVNETSFVIVPRLPMSASAKRGEGHYKAICTQCHQPDGQGSPGVFPPLSGSDWFTRNPDHAIMVTLKGIAGPIKVNGKDFNGAMPGQGQLSDQEVADVINYARMGFSKQVGEIDAERVKAVRKRVEKMNILTEKDVLKSVAKPQLSESIDLSGSKGNSKDAKMADFKDLPNGMVQDAAKSGVDGYFSIETVINVKENRQWARVWDLGSSAAGEGKSSVGTDYILLTPRASSGKLRLSAKHKGEELFIDWKPIETGKDYKVTVRFTPNSMKLYVDDKYIGLQLLPNQLDLRKLPDNNNWLGRSQFGADPLFSGDIKEFKVYNF